LDLQENIEVHGLESILNLKNEHNNGLFKLHLNKCKQSF
jgi:hypothetical protein